MSTFVLVHGAWHCGDAWEEVARHLRAEGHEVHAPTLAGNGPGDSKEADLSAAIESLVAYIDGHAISDSIVVGHSYGGMVITGAADRLSPGTIRRLVYSSAYVPRDGESLVDLSPPGMGEFFDQLRQPDGGLPLPYELWREGLMNDADESTARIYYERLNPQPHAAMIEPIRLEADPAELPCKKSYIHVSEDTTISQSIGGWHPRFSDRLGLYRLVAMPGGHEVLFTNPELLARKIIEAGRD